MAQYVCSGCYFSYDEETGIPEMGIPPGTVFDDIPDSWCCPECGFSKEEFNRFDDKAPLKSRIAKSD